jgi:hypothetical protein
MSPLFGCAPIEELGVPSGRPEVSTVSRRLISGPGGHQTLKKVSRDTSLQGLRDHGKVEAIRYLAEGRARGKIVIAV